MVAGEHPLTAALRVVRDTPIAAGKIVAPPARERNEPIEAPGAAAQLVKRATIAKRSLEDTVLSDGTCTPSWICDLLPPRDYDPCSNPRSHVKATRALSLENGDDGLAEPWLGSAFVNWPFSRPLPWAYKAQGELAAGHCTDLIVLCKLDTSTRSWKVITARVDGFALDLWMPDERIQFDEHPDLIERRRVEQIIKAQREGKSQAMIDRITGKSTANFVSVLLHHRPIDSEPWRKFGLFAKRWVQS